MVLCVYDTALFGAVYFRALQNVRRAKDGIEADKETAKAMLATAKAITALTENVRTVQTALMSGRGGA